MNINEVFSQIETVFAQWKAEPTENSHADIKIQEISQKITALLAKLEGSTTTQTQGLLLQNKWKVLTDQLLVKEREITGIHEAERKVKEALEVLKASIEDKSQNDETSDIFYKLQKVDKAILEKCHTDEVYAAQKKRPILFATAARVVKKLLQGEYGPHLKECFLQGMLYAQEQFLLLVFLDCLSCKSLSENFPSMTDEEKRALAISEKEIIEYFEHPEQSLGENHSRLMQIVAKARLKEKEFGILLQYLRLLYLPTHNQLIRLLFSTDSPLSFIESTDKLRPFFAQLNEIVKAESSLKAGRIVNKLSLDGSAEKEEILKDFLALLGAKQPELAFEIGEAKLPNFDWRSLQKQILLQVARHDTEEAKKTLTLYWPLMGEELSYIIALGAARHLFNFNPEWKEGDLREVIKKMLDFHDPEKIAIHLSKTKEPRSENYYLFAHYLIAKTALEDIEKACTITDLLLNIEVILPLNVEGLAFEWSLLQQEQENSFSLPLALFEKLHEKFPSENNNIANIKSWVSNFMDLNEIDTLQDALDAILEFEENNSYYEVAFLRLVKRFHPKSIIDAVDTLCEFYENNCFTDYADEIEGYIAEKVALSSFQKALEIIGQTDGKSFLRIIKQANQTKQRIFSESLWIESSKHEQPYLDKIRAELCVNACISGKILWITVSELMSSIKNPFVYGETLLRIFNYDQQKGNGHVLDHSFFFIIFEKCSKDLKDLILFSYSRHLPLFQNFQEFLQLLHCIQRPRNINTAFSFLIKGIENVITENQLKVLLEWSEKCEDFLKPDFLLQISGIWIRRNFEKGLTILRKIPDPDTFIFALFKLISTATSATMPSNIKFLSNYFEETSQQYGRDTLYELSQQYVQSPNKIPAFLSFIIKELAKSDLKKVFVLVDLLKDTCLRSQIISCITKVVQNLDSSQAKQALEHALHYDDEERLSIFDMIATRLQKSDLQAAYSFLQEIKDPNQSMAYFRSLMSQTQRIEIAQAEEFWQYFKNHKMALQTEALGLIASRLANADLQKALAMLEHASTSSAFTSCFQTLVSNIQKCDGTQAQTLLEYVEKCAERFRTGILGGLALKVVNSDVKTALSIVEKIPDTAALTHYFGLFVDHIQKLEEAPLEELVRCIKKCEEESQPRSFCFLALKIAKTDPKKGLWFFKQSSTRDLSVFAEYFAVFLKSVDTFAQIEGKKLLEELVQHAVDQCQERAEAPILLELIAQKIQTGKIPPQCAFALTLIRKQREMLAE